MEAKPQTHTASGPSVDEKTVGVGASYAAKSISCLLPVGWFKTFKGTESGSGMISFLAGIGSGNARSLSPWKPPPSLQMLYCTVAVRSVHQKTMALTRPLAKIANCSLGDRFCCSNIAAKAG